MGKPWCGLGASLDTQRRVKASQTWGFHLVGEGTAKRVQETLCPHTTDSKFVPKSAVSRKSVKRERPLSVVHS